MGRDRDWEERKESLKRPRWYKDTTIQWTIAFVMIGVFLVGLLMWGAPKYKVYRADLAGQAALAESVWTKKVSIEVAKAAYESSDWNKKKTIRDAEAVAEANAIIGDSLKGNDAYLRFLWIQNVGKDSDGERIYIATEAGLPILEARDSPTISGSGGKSYSDWQKSDNVQRQSSNNNENIINHNYGD